MNDKCYQYTMGLSGVQEIYHKSFCTPVSRRLSGVHKLEWQTICTPGRHTVLRFFRTLAQKPNVLIFVWCNVNIDTQLTMSLCLSFLVCMLFHVTIASWTGNVMMNYTFQTTYYGPTLNTHLSSCACTQTQAAGTRLRWDTTFHIPRLTVGYGFLNPCC